MSKKRTAHQAKFSRVRKAVLSQGHKPFTKAYGAAFKREWKKA